MLSEDKIRWSISGWFHGPPIERPPPYVEPAKPLLPYGSVEVRSYARTILVNPSFAVIFNSSVIFCHMIQELNDPERSREGFLENIGGKKEKMWIPTFSPCPAQNLGAQLT